MFASLPEREAHSPYPFAIQLEPGNGGCICLCTTLETADNEKCKNAAILDGRYPASIGGDLVSGLNR